MEKESSVMSLKEVPFERRTPQEKLRVKELRIVQPEIVIKKKQEEDSSPRLLHEAGLLRSHGQLHEVCSGLYLASPDSENRPNVDAEKVKKHEQVKTTWKMLLISSCLEE